MKKTDTLSETFKKFISILPDTNTYWVAYSGGIDSSVLLHLLKNNTDNKKIKVVHINHGLSKHAKDWEKFTARICQKMNLPYHSFKIELPETNGESIEALGRDKRHDIYKGLLKPDEILFTGHHQDDQVETFFLQLLRGCGPEGLSAMGKLTRFSDGWLARPMLENSRQQISNYAHQESLEWVEDESNKYDSYDRNFLRNKIIPLLKERWPALGMTLSRSIQHQVDAAHILKTTAMEDFRNIQNGSNNRVNIPALQNLDDARKKNVIRYWISSNGFRQPNAAIINNICNEVINARSDAVPCISWDLCEIRRYRNNLYIMEKINPVEKDMIIQWDLKTPLTIENGKLYAEENNARGVEKKLIRNDNVQVRYRRGGESMHLPGKKHSQKLKKLFQEAGIPPWTRSITPLIYIDEKLAVVPGLWIDDDFKTEKGQTGIDIIFLRH